MNDDERRRLLVRFLIICVGAGLIGWLVARIWQPGTASHELVASIQAGLGLPPGEVGLEAVSSGALGLYFGLLALYGNDVRKRFQAVLLLAGSVVALGVMAALGTLLPNIEPFRPSNWGAVMSGLAGAGLLELGTLLAIDIGSSRLGHARSRDGQSLRFVRAGRGLIGVVVMLVVGGLVQGFLIGTPLVVPAGLVAIVFLMMFTDFVRYEASDAFAVLGPGGSGKTMFLLGLYMTVRRRLTELSLWTAPHPNRGMKELIKAADAQSPDSETWPADANARGAPGLSEIAFSYVVGEALPVELSLKATDHAGEHLRDLARYLRGEPHTATDGGKPRLNLDADPRVAAGDEEEDNETEREDTGPGRRDDTGVSEDSISNGDDGDPESWADAAPQTPVEDFFGDVEQADTLILLLDVERLLHPDRFTEPRLHTDELDDVVQHTDDRTVFIVATKCDLLVEPFQSETMSVRHPADDEDVFYAFREYVTSKLRTNEGINTLLDDAFAETIHPVFYRTTDDGLPALDDDERLQTVGYDRLLDAIERDR